MSTPPKKHTEFEARIIATFCDMPKEEVEAFFEKHFLQPLVNQLDSQEEKDLPAEYIRQQRKQTKKIMQILLTFDKR
jgi:hypothetical protein